MSTNMRIGLIGHSHMGIVASVGFASLGYEVSSVDKEQEIALRLAKGELPISEPGLGEFWQKYHDKIVYSSDFSLLKDCQAVFLVKDTPTDETNAGNVEVLFALVDDAAPHLSQDVIFVSMSQLPVGFSRRIKTLLQEKRPDLRLGFYTWVETLVIGDAMKRFLEPERIIFGAEEGEKALPVVLEEVAARFQCPLIKMGFESAELTKAAINLYLASSVTFANTLADLCEASGADIDEIIPALQLDRRIGKFAYIKPGLGIAGGNLERDLVMLSRIAEAQGGASFLRTIIEYNQKRFEWLVEKLRTLVLEKTKSPTIALWGLAYKKDTASLKNAPSLKVIQWLRGKAGIRAYDPVVRSGEGLGGVVMVDEKYKALEGADCLIVLTDWDEFREVNLAVLAKIMRQPIVVDCVKALSGVPKIEGGAVRYYSMGN